jgi:phosphopantothenoylcysteine decarboxylase / phosphopantothenate---cysteine ligase
VQLATPPGVERSDVRSALDMQRALAHVLGPDLRGADALLMCAAIADYRPRQQHATKLKRGQGPLTLELVPNPDLLAELGAARRGRAPLLVGFALETLQGDALIAAARQKLAHKRVDAIVANYSLDALGTDDTRAALVTASAERWLGPGPKRDVADAIVTFVAESLGAG